MKKPNLCPWIKKNIDIKKLCKEYLNGKTVNKLSKEYKIPVTTVNRWLHQNDVRLRLVGLGQGQQMKWHRFEDLDFEHQSYIVKRQLIALRGHKCEICGYSKIIEAHHIIPRRDSGPTSEENLILLCPNHHAEADYGLLSLDHYKMGSNRGNLNSNAEGNPEGNAGSIPDSVETEALSQGRTYQGYLKKIEHWLKYVKTPETIV
jgi:5-methylcytosine-specific restriction endonuclease McrA